MKNIKKTASLFLAYLFVLSILPLGILTKTASAEGVPEYLKYSENYLRTKLQYKDVSLVGYINPRVTDEYVVKRISKNGESYISHGYPYVIGDKFITTDEGIYDVYEEKYIKTNEEIESYAQNVLNNKYNGNSTLTYASLQRVEKDGNMWIMIGFTVEDVYSRGIITPSGQIIEKFDPYVYSIDDNGFWNYGSRNVEQDNIKYTILHNYNKSGVNKEFSIRQPDEGGHIFNFISVNNDLYASYYLENEIVTYKYDLNDLESSSAIKIEGLNLHDISVDKDNNIWRTKEGYVQKLDGTSWTNIYKVDSRMNGIEVYDNNHMIVTGWWPEYKAEGGYNSKGIYTIINNGDVIEPGNGQGGETPQNPTPGNNGEGAGSETDNDGDNKTPVVVDKGTDDTGNKFVEVSKLPNKDSVNSIEIDTKDSKAFTAEITDINTIKEGKGSLNIKGGNTVINLPFSTINKDLLKDGSKVVLTSKVEDNSDITKNIKGLKKVFNFELSVVDKDNNVTAIHQFNDGQAEITITLSDEDLKGLDKAKLAVFYYNEETKLFEVIDTKVNGNNVTFRTPHFSKYIIAEKADENTSGGETQNPPQENNSLEQSSNEKELPQTGSLATQNQVLAIGMLILISGAAILYSKRKRA